MLRMITMLAALLVTAGPSLAADNDGTARGSERPGDIEKQWRMFDAEMSPTEYRDAVRENQKLARRLVKSYSNETLTAVGVPDAGVTALGVAAGLAIDGDATWHLNESRTMAFSLDDVVSDDRALMFTIKKHW
jgi:hypothetical protein